MSIFLQQKLLDKEMTRQEFLQLFLGLVLSIFGLSGFIGILSNSKYGQIVNKSNPSHGFGSNKFGV